jgi:hypothetical protein
MTGVTLGLWVIIWSIAELTKQPPYCSTCGRTQASAGKVVDEAVSANVEELAALRRQFEEIGQAIAGLNEEEIAAIESCGITSFPSRDDFDPSIPAYSSLDDMNHHMSRIHLEAISLLNRLELVLGERPSPDSRSR